MLLCSFKKEKTGSIFPTFYITFHHALITCCNVAQAGYIAYHYQDTFDFSQGHVTKNQPMTVRV